MELAEVLLYLYLHAPSIIAEQIKRGENNVRLEYSYFLTTPAARREFFHHTGFIPLEMRGVLTRVKLPVAQFFWGKDDSYIAFRAACDSFRRESSVDFDLRDDINDVLFRILVGMNA